MTSATLGSAPLGHSHPVTLTQLVFTKSCDRGPPSAVLLPEHTCIFTAAHRHAAGPCGLCPLLPCAETSPEPAGQGRVTFRTWVQIQPLHQSKQVCSSPRARPEIACHQRGHPGVGEGCHELQKVGQGHWDLGFSCLVLPSSLWRKVASPPYSTKRGRRETVAPGLTVLVTAAGGGLHSPAGRDGAT
ncbi:hypothetical protein H1C71_041692 [Ictidomys tridecemlineatus]|nr:hypothetical protein H1C71_041692 [Ictidomys tridecemlineatus]